MSQECIHGLEGTQCAICFPQKQQPDAPAARAARVAAPRTRRTATTTTTKRATIAGRATPARDEAPRTASLTTARLFHVTHASNLPGILDARRILPAGYDTGDRLAFDASSEHNRAARAGITLDSGLTVDQHVPFYLSPGANVWQSIIQHVDDPRLSERAKRSAAAEYVMLVVPVTDVLALATEAESPIVVADGDAAGPLTSFAETETDARRALARALAEPEPDVSLRAEVLVPFAVPFSGVAVLGVPNTTARDAARRVLGKSSTPKVAVYPPWFRPPVE